MAAGTPRKKGANGATGRIKAARNARPTTSQTSSTLPEPKSRVRRWAGRSGRWVALVFCFLVAVLLVAPNLFYQPPKYLVAQTPDQDLEAIVTFAVTDEEALQAGRDEINSRSEFYYRYQKSTAAQIRRQQEDLFRHARELVQAPPDSPPADHSSTLAEWVREEQGREIETDLARRVLERSDDLNIQQTFEEAVRDLYQNRGIVENLERYSEQDNAGRVHVSGSPDALLIKPPFMLAIDDVGRFIAEKYGDTNEIQILRASDRSFICDLAQAYVRPNILYQPDTTEATRERKLEKLRKDPPKREFEKGQILVDQGERLTRQDLDLLLAMYEAYGRTLYRRLLAVAVYVALLCGLVFYYMREFRDDLHLSTSNVFLVALPILLALALGRIALGIVSPASTAGYLFPAGLIGMLAVILLGTRSGILLVTIGALAFSISTNLDYKIFLTALLGGYAAVTGLKNARERKEVLKAGLVVGAVNAITILLINYIDDPISPKLALMFWGLANGLACGVIALSVLVPFERLFGVVTDIRLLELTGLDHPLLKNLEEKAPGSFQHCLNVCKLA
ncbi:hypothetical protein HQ520_19200 [bacterium]|nr:hypothetical protein [bacterium]